MSVKSTDDWATSLTWTLLPVGRAWQKAAGMEFNRLGMSLSEGAALLVVARLGDGVSQRDVAEEAVIDPAAIARSVLALERDGLLARRQNPTDSRAKALFLTPAGASRAQQLDAALHELRSRALAGLDDADGRAAVRVLVTLDRACRAMLTTPS